MTRSQLQLSVGEKFLIHFAGETNSIKTEVVGFSNDNYVIVHAPLIPGIRQKALENNEIIVRYFNEGIVYGFKSNLINYLNKPEPLLFITYPNKIEKMELRKNRRVSCNIPAKIYIEDKDYQGLIVDISIQGCRIFIDGLKNSEINNFEQEEPIYLDLSLLTENNNINIKGIIKNITNQKYSVFLGILFDAQTESLNPVSDYLEYVDNMLNTIDY